MDIEIKNLTKAFKGIKVLDSISFKVEGPGITGYLGPNGAGKTTTFKILANLMKANSGSALINGVDSRDYKTTLKAASFLIDNPEPYSDMTIKDFLTFIGGARSMSKDKTEKRIKELRKILNLEDLNKRCGELSKGNKRRVVIASVLLPDTDILVLDEPTAGLDPIEAHEIKKVLKDLGRRKLIFLSSHIIDEIKELCKKVIFINNGKIIASGPVKAIEKKFGKGKGFEKAYINIFRGENGE